MLGTLIIANNFIHDLAAAIWICGILSIWWFKQNTEKQVFAKVFRFFSKITIGSLIFVLLCGTVRAFTYKQFEWYPFAGEGQVIFLMIKHIFFVTSVIVGLVYQFRLRKTI